MKIKDMTTYKNGHGAECNIMGATRDYPQWVWSIQGFWYDRATGRHIGYRVLNRGTREETGEHFVQEPSSADLVTEIGTYSNLPT